MIAMQPQYTIKQTLLSNKNWWAFYEHNKDNIRPDIEIAITKLLSCKHVIRGYQEYHCSDSSCPHIKRVPHTCKSKPCSSCGKKATEIWISKQLQTLPNTSWQHITFTMPSELWGFFWHNRELINRVPKIAADCIKSIAKKKQLILGIFIAIHTFGHDLKRNVYIHLSTTLSGISKNGDKWLTLYFKKDDLMTMWRYRIIKLFRNAHKKQALDIPSSIKKKLNHTFSFNQLLNQLYQKRWIIHYAKPTHNHHHSVKYLGRYVKRPPIAESKLRHYDGHNISFRFLNRKTKTYEKYTMPPYQFISRFVAHIPDKGFRMIRYYGFLANAIKGKLLPSVYQKINQIVKGSKASTNYAQLMFSSFGFRPLDCVLCGKTMLLTSVSFGKANADALIHYHKQLALAQKC